MPTKRAEASLKSFLTEAAQAYAEDAYTERMERPDLIKAEYDSGFYLIEDTFSVSSDNRVYNGREEVYLCGKGIPYKRIWAASYHGTVLPRRKPEPILEVYKEVLREPDPELPIRGPRNIKIGDYEYNLSSVHGPLSVARFAVIEEITKNGTRVYRGDIAGGWMNG